MSEQPDRAEREFRDLYIIIYNIESTMKSLEIEKGEIR